MALLEITLPVDDEIDHWDQVVVIEESEYRFRVEWSTREEAWYLSISDQDGNDLAMGLKLVEGCNVLRRETDTRLPQGKLVLLDVTGATEETTRDELGTRWVLLYDEAG